MLTRGSHSSAGGRNLGGTWPCKHGSAAVQESAVGLTGSLRDLGARIRQ